MILERFAQLIILRINNFQFLKDIYIYFLIYFYNILIKF